MFETKVIKNIISNEYANKIEDFMFSIPWHFHNNLTYSNFNNLCDVEYGFIHRFYDEKILTKEFNFIEPLFYEICKKINLENFSLIRSYSFLQTKLDQHNKINDIHVNSLDKHIVICYYVHDIDGETVIYDQTINDTNIMYLNQEERKKQTKNFEVHRKILPEKNKVVIFDGSRYHASSSPSKGPRCVINFDIKTDKHFYF